MQHSTDNEPPLRGRLVNDVRRQKLVASGLGTAGRQARRPNSHTGLLAKRPECSGSNIILAVFTTMPTLARGKHHNMKFHRFALGFGYVKNYNLWRQGGDSSSILGAEGMFRKAF